MLRFADPQFLWLLVLIPAVWLMARRLRSIERGRRFAILAIRTLMLLCIIFALSRLELRRTSRDLSVFYLLDVSDSVPAALRDQQLEEVARLSKLSTPRDRTGVIVFGAEPSMETSPVKNFDFEGRLFSQVSGERSDISSAVRLALAAFPSDTMRRIVLMTDGNENLGSALDVARIAQGGGVPIDVVPLRYDAQNDVQLEKVVVPQRTAKDAPFDVKIFLTAQQETEATLRVFADGELIHTTRVNIRPGKNPPFVLPQRLLDGGFHTYTATVEAADDLRPQNNRGSAFTYLKAEPRVLLVEGDSFESARFLAGALQAENIVAEVQTPSAIPISLDELQRYDSIVLSNVSADMMSGAQMQMIERAVHDLGIGLIMIGGERSFGAGGYTDTPIERALPVTMDVKQKKMLPNGALVIVLHTCEIPNGNAHAREITLASLNVLSSQDYFGLVYFGQPMAGGAAWGEFWAWEPGLQQVGDKRMMRNVIKGVQPLDMPTFDPTLKLAAEGLDKVKTQTKHIIIISDGDPAPPSQAFSQSIRNRGITISTVAIAPHNGMTVDTLKNLAYWGSGNFYYPKDFSELPRIFTKEATVVRKSLIREEDFVPRYMSTSEILMGMGELPQLHGYVVASMKELATEALSTEWDDPLLAHWRYGLGKTVAFTSDAKDKWGSTWVQWGGYAKFWSQTVRWSLRETNSGNFQVTTELDGGRGRVTIDAVDDSGNFQNFIDFAGTVIGPDFEPVNVDVSQIAPGRYEGTFPAGKVGTYMVSMQANGEEGEDPQFITSGVAMAYSPEYQTSASSDEFMERLASTAGGVVVNETYNPYLRNLSPTRSPEQMWPWLLLLGTLLLPMDIFVRRVYLSRKEVLAWAQKNLFGWIPHREEKEVYDQRMDTLRAAKARATSDKAEERREQEARAAFRDRLAERESEQPDSGKIFASEEDSPKPVVRTSKQTYTADNEGPQPPQQGGMGSLMEAKKRAQQQKRKK